MRNIISSTICVLGLAMLFSCTQTSTKCTIKGNFGEGTGKVTIPPFQRVQTMEDYKRLSFETEIVNGSFSLELDSIEALRRVDVNYGDQRQSFQFFSEPGTIEIVKEGDQFQLMGGKLQEEYLELTTKLDVARLIQLSSSHSKEQNTEKEKKELENKLWSLSKEYSSSIPLSQMFYEVYSSADLPMLTKIINAFSSEIHNSYYLSQLIESKKREEKIAIGQPAPDFNLPDVDGNLVNQEKYKGKYLLIDFWASWCGGCRAGIPNLKEVHKAFNGKGLELLSISIDQDKEKWLKAVEEEDMPWEQLLDTKKMFDEYNSRFVPFMVFITPEGKIANKGIFHGEDVWEELHKLGFKK